MDIIQHLDELRTQLKQWRADGDSIALVPTMGALHKGHMALVQAAKQSCDRIVLSIFVNPKQFGVGEDYETYPRTFEADQATAKEQGVDCIWAPNAKTMYPQGFATSVKVAELGEKLCGKTRPIFFEGVTTVVNKLLMQVLPDHAFFGEKDFQQLTIIKRMAADCNIPTNIIGVPTMREDDGLAYSSRNSYLSEFERKIAPTLYTVLCETRANIQTQGQVQQALESATEQLLSAGFDQVDYVEYVDNQTLNALERYTKNSRLCAAARLGNTRLIDNIEG